MMGESERDQVISYLDQLRYESLKVARVVFFMKSESHRRMCVKAINLTHIYMVMSWFFCGIPSKIFTDYYFCYLKRSLYIKKF